MKKTEQSSTSNPKVILPNKDLVGVRKPESIDKKEKNIAEDSTKLPSPTGWRILVLPFKQKQKTSGGIYLADETVERSQVASTCGLVYQWVLIVTTKRDTLKVRGANSSDGAALAGGSGS